MYKSMCYSVFFALFLTTIPLSVKSGEAVASLSDGPALQAANIRTVTSPEPYVAGEPERPAAGARNTLDIAFVISNALLGFLLLRRANRS